MAPPHRPRRLRLPQRLDYTLVPAPLDLSLPSITEKSPLPAIIVTPSSPTFDKNYYIAFLATEPPPPQPTFIERIKTDITSPIKSSFPSASTSRTSWKCNAFKMAARLMFILALMMFVMAVHVITHRLATQRPHLEFRVMGAADEGSAVGSWFGFRELWAGGSDDDLGISTGSHEAGLSAAVGIPVEGGAWVSSNAINTNEKNTGHGHGHGSQERDIEFVVVEDPPSPAPPSPPQAQAQDVPSSAN